MKLESLSEQTIAEINPFINSPEVGSVFTARLDIERGKKDYVTHIIKNFTGYVKNNKRNPQIMERLVEGDFYRFIVVAVHSEKRHNYFQIIPFREVGERESKNFNYLDPEGFLKIKKLAERLLGIKYKKRKKS